MLRSDERGEYLFKFIFEFEMRSVSKRLVIMIIMKLIIDVIVMIMIITTVNDDILTTQFDLLLILNCSIIF